MPGCQHLGAAEVNRPHSASSCAPAPAQAPFAADLSRGVFSVSFDSSAINSHSRRVWRAVGRHHKLTLGNIPTVHTSSSSHLGCLSTNQFFFCTSGTWPSIPTKCSLGTGRAIVDPPLSMLSRGPLGHGSSYGILL